MRAGGRTATRSIIPRGILITLTLFGALTGIVFVTRKDFSFMRSVLFFGGIAAMGLVVASIALRLHARHDLQLRDDRPACGYILYDTSNVMLHYRTSQHVAAALALFASVMLLFWYVLRILIDRRR